MNPSLTQTAKNMAAAWLAEWRVAASPGALGRDLMAGLTVATVALPLNIALAMASGLDARAGLVAGALGGAIAATFGGSRFQVTGPAAALSTMVLAYAAQAGPTGVAFLAFMTGILIAIASFTRAAGWIQHMPETVLAGFTTGVGLKLLDQQLPVAFGLVVQEDAQTLQVNTLAEIATHHSIDLLRMTPQAVLCAVIVVGAMLGFKAYPRIPAGLFGIVIATVLCSAEGWDVARVPSFNGALPTFVEPIINLETLTVFLTLGLPIAILAAVESLLAARVADRLSGTKHNSNLELLGQGIANTVVGLFGGLPVTGVVVRTSVNVTAGARSRVSSLFHGLILFAALLTLGSIVGEVPLAALAGLLAVVGYRLLDVEAFKHAWKEGWPHALAFLTAAIGTVSGKLITGLVVAILIEVAVAQLAKSKQKPASANGVRAIVADAHPVRGPVVADFVSDVAMWSKHVGHRPHVPRSAFVHDQATVIGKVVLGEHVHIAAGSSVRADEGTPFYIGASTNIQDGVVIHALKDKHVLVRGERWAVYVGQRASLAHGALIHGPTYIGEDTFVGFNAIVHDSVLGEGCFIGHGAIVVGVELAPHRFVAPGSVIDTPAAAAALPEATAGHAHFNEDVVEVNRGLAAAYLRRPQQNGAPPKSFVHAATHGPSMPVPHKQRGRRAGYAPSARSFGYRTPRTAEPSRNLSSFKVSGE